MGDDKNTFHLAKGVYYVKGAERGALCDTNSGSVFSINETACKVLEAEIIDDAYWKQLVELDLAVPGDNYNGQVINSFPKEEIGLEFIWFEILSDDCNERCTHCYADSMPPTYRKDIGLIPLEKKSKNQARKLSFQEWLQLIGEGYKLGCRNGQFIGGEPFLYRGEGDETVLDLAAHARSLGYEQLEIFTNATLLNNNKVAQIKDLGLSIAVSLYSSNSKIHDQITRTPGSHKKTMAALQRLLEMEIPTRVETILMSLNEHTVESTITLIDDIGFSHRLPDVLRPKGRGDNPNLLPSPELLAQYGLIIGPNFHADTNFFTRSCNGHNCLAGKITITDNGDVLPCIFSRSKIMGNVVALGSLEAAVNREALQTIWNTTKDNVLVCQDCEYRYVCFDCRPISEAVAGKEGSYISAPYPRCTYNPYTGVWAGGVWRLDLNGKPFYDETLASAIEKVRESGANVAVQRGH